ncbi:hypothetical protein ACUHMQ_16675 [Chitinimonas sp. PSY-7]|uniref:hypothetical protein n=1 Tax=Chitinimonas sp. PSY-7 TaxID=3459088 RepID=UPI00403FE3CA
MSILFSKSDQRTVVEVLKTKGMNLGQAHGRMICGRAVMKVRKDKPTACTAPCCDAQAALNAESAHLLTKLIAHSAASMTSRHDLARRETHILAKQRIERLRKEIGECARSIRNQLTPTPLRQHVVTNYYRGGQSETFGT